MGVSGLIEKAVSLPLAAGRRILRQREEDHFHGLHKAEADRAYDQLRRSPGRSDLDSSMERQIREYCAEVLGSAKFTPWMRVYAVYQGRFREGWIPDDYFALRVLPSIFGEGRPIQHKRTLSRRIFHTELFPDLAYFVRGRWFTSDYEMISLTDLEELVFSHTNLVFLKEEGSCRGRGVKRLRREEFREVVPSQAQDAVVQAGLTQHPWFDEIYSKSVATLRVMTTNLDAGGPRHRGSFLRLVYGGGHFQTGGVKSILWAVVDDEGTMASDAMDETWWPIQEHPDSGFPFADSRMPYFERAVQTCLELHLRVPHDPIIGWDVSIGEGGSVGVMEWNSGHSGITFPEAALGPIFADCGFEKAWRVPPG